MANKIELFKFPRTKHLFDAGGSGVTRDDLLMDKGEEALFYSSRQDKSKQQIVTIEEKVDGANLGISLGKDLKIRVQNRSHFVDSSSHKQFSTLDTWLEAHSSELYEVLQPERHVLFGEWLYAKHSIHYTRLPDLFLVFDVYDRENECFYSSAARNDLLKGTSLKCVRSIAETTLHSRNDVRKSHTL